MIDKAQTIVIQSNDSPWGKVIVSISAVIVAVVGWFARRRFTKNRDSK